LNESTLNHISKFCHLSKSKSSQSQLIAFHFSFNSKYHAIKYPKTLYSIQVFKYYYFPNLFKRFYLLFLKVCLSLLIFHKGKLENKKKKEQPEGRQAHFTHFESVEQFLFLKGEFHLISPNRNVKCNRQSAFNILYIIFVNKRSTCSSDAKSLE